MPDVEALLNAIDAAEQTAYGADSDQGAQLEDERAKAINYYLGANLNPAPEGRSQVRDRSVYETIQWILPSLCRIFANGDDLVEIPPVGPEDEEAAKQEGEYLNHIIVNKNPWFQICHDWFTDALLTKNAYAYAFREKRVDTEVERYERQTPEALALLTQDKGVQIIGVNEYPDEESPPQPVMDPLSGQPILDEQGQPVLQPLMLFDVELRRSKERGHICIEVLPPERVKVSERTPNFRLDRCDYFEYWDYKTISELRAQGFDVPDDIAGDENIDTEEDYARDRFGERSQNSEYNPADPAMRRVKVRCVWIRFDYDEDGIAELQKCVVVGKELLDREEVNRIPVASIVPYPMPHRHIGLSTADIVADIQDIKTAILRQGLDNLYLSNNGRTAVNTNQVNLDDVLLNRPGGVIRVNGIPAENLMPVQVPFVFPQAMQGLEYMDQIKENRTGTNRYFTGIDQNALNKTATGIQQLSTMAAQRVEQIARIFAAGIEDLVSIVHELVIKSGHKPDVVKLRGQWVQIDPAQWRKRTDFRISVGFAAGNKDAMVARLSNILQMQREAIQIGVASPQNIYNALVELTKASDFAAPERFWTDPSTLGPPAPPQPDVTVMEAEKLRAQAQLESERMKAETDKYESDNRVSIEKYRADLDAEVKLTLENIRTNSSVQLENVRAGTQAQLRQLESEQSLSAEERKIQLKNQPSVELAQKVEEMAAALGNAIESMQGALSTLLTAKRQIRRGKNGKAEGVDIVGPDGNVIASQNVVRDKQGRVIGSA